jgi:hypothetical protein
MKRASARAASGRGKSKKTIGSFSSTSCLASSELGGIVRGVQVHWMRKKSSRGERMQTLGEVDHRSAPSFAALFPFHHFSLFTSTLSASLSPSAPLSAPQHLLWRPSLLPVRFISLIELDLSIFRYTGKGGKGCVYKDDPTRMTSRSWGDGSSARDSLQYSDDKH